MPQKVHIGQSVLLIGRGHANHVRPIADARVSRSHAAISRDSQGLLIRDLESANGTWVNDSRVGSQVRLAVGDRVRVGETELLVQADHMVMPDSVLYASSPGLVRATASDSLPLIVVALSLVGMAVVLLAIGIIRHDRVTSVTILSPSIQPAFDPASASTSDEPSGSTDTPTSTATPTISGARRQGSARTSAPAAPLLEVMVNFAADDVEIPQGGCTTLRWDVKNIRTVHVWPGIGGVSGENQARKVCPNTTTDYILEVVKRDGQTERRSVTVKVRPSTRPPSPTVTITPVTSTNPVTAPVASNTPTAIALITLTPTPSSLDWKRPADGSTWLETLNAYRHLAGLPALAEDPGISQGCTLHARYCVKSGVLQHAEDPASPWYSPEGAAGGNEVLDGSYSASASGRQAIEDWLQTVFHCTPVLSPYIDVVGYGTYSDGVDRPGFNAPDWVASLRWRTRTSQVPLPFMWPPPDGIQPILESHGEAPDSVIEPCGYSWPVGSFVTLFNDAPVAAGTFGSLEEVGAGPLEACVYDEHSFKSANPSLGRALLAASNRVVLIPRRPLRAGTSYRAHLQVNKRDFVWRFATASQPIR